MQLYFIRHGESEANVKNEFSNTPGKHPLTALGHSQAEALSESLRALNVAAIYASPLMRAIQTAEIVAAPHNLPVLVSAALLEHHAGELEGRADPDSWKQYIDLFGVWAKGDLDARIPGGESFNELRARFMPFLQSVEQEYAASDGAVLMVAHGGLYLMMLPLVLKNITREFAFEHGLGNTGYVVAERRGDDLICLEWAGVLV